ncbi:solute carrier organic anion transporter family member 1B3-like [Ochotona curzoniae]|uniref:solute carrier organic anion transporter family member 1B3-like n=1 Tax=Ochotona curzoniae TaxID=130825 RepID=UPI001B348BCB|nr:solute carrier organic anion transporter family member 1B3-like [Ochotona curzoniae]
MDQNQPTTATEAKPSKNQRGRFCDAFKMFLAALSLSYICKALSGTIMKSSITQIERRFDISSSVAGVIDGGFEIGSLFVILFVSYFGSKLHRPKIIGIGSLIMGAGSILTALPHFFMGYYRYSMEEYSNPSENSTSSFTTCSAYESPSFNGTAPEITGKGCGKESGSNMWMYVLMGNMLRGIGETPIVPLGISYIDDFAKEGTSSFYLGTLNAIGMIGPIIGFVLGSLFAKMYVDIGFVDLSTIRITPKDARWVGAWWLGFLVAGTLSIISSIPFFFLPKNPNEPEEKRKASKSVYVLKTNEDKSQAASLTGHGQTVTGTVTGFFTSLKSIIINPMFVLFLFVTLLQFSSFVGSLTYSFKYVEQQYGQSASQANFVLGLVTIPSVAIGMLIGGYIIKKFKFTLVGIAKFSFSTSVLSFLFFLSQFALTCENKPVAGLTLTYDGNYPVTSHLDVPLSHCNSDCNCDESQWEPVCGSNGVTYTSPCLAGCKSFSGHTKPTVFHNCTCVEKAGLQKSNFSASLGECPRGADCTRKYHIYLAMQVLTGFSVACSGPSFILLVVRVVQPELKSLAMGFHSLMIRTLGGILAPVYFGALIDRTCLKWSVTSCGARGTCRLYNSVLFGNRFLGLSTFLKSLALILYVVLISVMKKTVKRKNPKSTENGKKALDDANLESLSSNGRSAPSAGADGEAHI